MALHARMHAATAVTEANASLRGPYGERQPRGRYAKRHEQEQKELVSDAFAPRPVTRKPKRLNIVKKA